MRCNSNSVQGTPGCVGSGTAVCARCRVRIVVHRQLLLPFLLARWCSTTEPPAPPNHLQQHTLLNPPAAPGSHHTCSMGTHQAPTTPQGQHMRVTQMAGPFPPLPASNTCTHTRAHARMSRGMHTPHSQQGAASGRLQPTHNERVPQARRMPFPPLCHPPGTQSQRHQPARTAHAPVNGTQHCRDQKDLQRIRAAQARWVQQSPACSEAAATHDT